MAGGDEHTCSFSAYISSEHRNRHTWARDRLQAEHCCQALPTLHEPQGARGCPSSAPSLPQVPSKSPLFFPGCLNITGGGWWGRRGSRLKGEGEAERRENTPEPIQRPHGRSHSHSRHVSLLSSAAQLRNISAAQSAIFESLQLLLGTGSAFCLAFSSERPVEGGGKKGRK